MYVSLSARSFSTRSDSSSRYLSMYTRLNNMSLSLRRPHPTPTALSSPHSHLTELTPLPPH
jgi:hypothetical protein